MWHDLTGQKFNNLLVIGRSKEGLPYSKERVWDCKCLLCGRVKQFTTRALITKRNLACGCLRVNDFTGRVFGKLTVIERARDRERDDHRTVIWKCLCVCGRVCYRASTNLLKQTKNPHSCGICTKKYKTKEEELLGQKYKSMIRRCCDPKDTYYHNYGGRGIYVCDEWLNDEFAFINWSLAHGYSPELSIDRIDNDGPYSPDNCRFVDKLTQDNNKRSNHYLVVDGLRQTLAQWCRDLGMDRTQIYSFSDKYTDTELSDLLSKFRVVNDTAMNLGGNLDTIRNHCRSFGMSDNDIANHLHSGRVVDLLDYLRMNYSLNGGNK